MATIELPLGVDWTPEILQDLPSDYRYELWEGKLVVAAAAMCPWHADGVGRICRLLVHEGRLAYIEQGVFLGPRDLVTSDVAGSERYAETRVVMLSTLEKESL